MNSSIDAAFVMIFSSSRFHVPLCEENEDVSAEFAEQIFAMLLESGFTAESSQPGKEAGVWLFQMRFQQCDFAVSLSVFSDEKWALSFHPRRPLFSLQRTSFTIENDVRQEIAKQLKDRFKCYGLSVIGEKEFLKGL